MCVRIRPGSDSVGCASFQKKFEYCYIYNCSVAEHDAYYEQHPSNPHTDLKVANLPTVTESVGAHQQAHMRGDELYNEVIEELKDTPHLQERYKLAAEWPYADDIESPESADSKLMTPVTNAYASGGCIPSAPTAVPISGERSWIVDSGAYVHLIGASELTPDEQTKVTNLDSPL